MEKIEQTQETAIVLPGIYFFTALSLITLFFAKVIINRVKPLEAFVMDEDVLFWANHLLHFVLGLTLFFIVRFFLFKYFTKQISITQEKP